MATPRNTYPEMLTKSTFLSAGNCNFIHMKISKVFTTDAAAAKPPEIRNCLFPDEEKMTYFKEYSQTNCYINKIIEEFVDKCGCVGKYRG